MKPKIHLEYYSRLYPSAWKQVDKFRAGRGKDLPFWPEWCFMPLAGAYAIVSAEAESQGIDITSPQGLPLVNDVGIIGALAAWRVTQGVYRFDPDIYKAVIETPLSGDIPHDVLFNLPEWCVYIETPGLTFLGSETAGFFAYLEHDANDGRKELRLVLDYILPENITAPGLQSLVIHLGPWSLETSLEKALQESSRQFDVMGLPEEFNFKQYVSDEEKAAKIMKNDYSPFVSLLLYICSVNSEIGDGKKRPVKPRAKKTKKGSRLFPPAKVSTWDVGVRMGAALRRARELAAENTAVEDSPETKRSSPRAHVRRAHWHHYWTGPRDGNKKLILKWLPPVPVGVPVGDLPVVIREIKKDDK